MTCDGSPGRPCGAPAAWEWSYRCPAGHRTARRRCQACHEAELLSRACRRLPRCGHDGCGHDAIMQTARPAGVTA